MHYFSQIRSRCLSALFFVAFSGAAFAETAEELAAKLISAGSEEEQFTARIKLLEIGPNAIPALATHLEDGDSIAASRAASVLGRISPCPYQAADPLARALKSGDEKKREAALQALLELQELGVRAVPILREILADPNSTTASKIAAVKALAAIGPLAEPALVELNQSFNSSDRELRDAVTLAVNGVSEARLISSLLGGEEEVRIAAARGLGKSTSSRSERALIRTLQNQLGESKMTDKILIAIFDAIGKRKLKSAAPTLAEVLLTLAHAETVEAGAMVLAVLDEPNSRAVIKQGVKSPDSRVRWRATIVLGEFRDKQEIDTLTVLIGDSATETVAIQALAKYGKDGEPAVKELSAILNRPDNTVSKLIEENEGSSRLVLLGEVCEALHKIGTKNAEFALDVFRTEIKGTSLETRFFAALDAPAESSIAELTAVPKLERLSKEDIDLFCRVDGPSMTAKAVAAPPATAPKSPS